MLKPWMELEADPAKSKRCRAAEHFNLMFSRTKQSAHRFLRNDVPQQTNPHGSSIMATDWLIPSKKINNYYQILNHNSVIIITSLIQHQFWMVGIFLHIIWDIILPIVKATDYMILRTGIPRRRALRGACCWLAASRTI